MDEAPAPGTRPEASAERLPRGLRLRLTVAIPLVVTFLVMLSGFLTLWLSYPLFFSTTRPASAEAVERRVTLAFLAVGGFALASLAASLILAASIARPLRALAARMKALARGPQRASRAADHTELDALGSAVEGVMSSVSSLILDSYTLRSLESGVLTLDCGGTVTSFNAVAEAILGCPAAEAIGADVSRVLPDEPPNHPFLASVRGALEGHGGASSAEALVRTRRGREVELGYSIAPLRDEGDASLGLVITFKDLAERKAAEQRLHRAENLALLGTMASSVAHEVRNPLAAINGLVELIRNGSPEDSVHRNYCERIIQSIERINRICQELLTVGNPEPRDVAPVDVNALARETVELCRYDTGLRETVVHQDLAADLPPILGDRERLGQVLLNILRNAFQAVRDGGEITVRTRATGQSAQVAVHNTGPPIAPEVRKQLFTLFFTTKQRGTGLGLAVSQQLVRAHGGRILVDSSPERGTTFTIELPVRAPSLAFVGG